MATSVAAFGLDQPWRAILGYHCDITMAIDAIHAEILRHGIPQALCGWAGMAVIAACCVGCDVWRIGGVMVRMYGIG